MSKRITVSKFQYISAFALVAIGSVIAVPGCAVEATEPDADQEESIVVVDDPSMNSESASVDDAEANSGDKEPGDPGNQAKKCWAICTTQSYGGAVCNATVAGYGEAGWLGTCNKACDRAKGDAAGHLTAGCGIYTCSFSGC